MLRQLNLEGEIARNSEPWEGVCCKACFFALEDTCVCKCNGAHHGEGLKNKGQIDPSYEKVLGEDEARIFRETYDPKRIHCLCGYDLSQEPIVYYTPHNAGWIVEGEPQKCWLYVKCPSCGYDMAIHKMGVTRE